MTRPETLPVAAAPLLSAVEMAALIPFSERPELRKLIKYITRAAASRAWSELEVGLVLDAVDERKRELDNRDVAEAGTPPDPYEEVLGRDPDLQWSPADIVDRVRDLGDAQDDWMLRQLPRGDRD